MNYFNKASIFPQTNSLTRAAIILTLIIIIVYSPLIFLNQIYADSFPFPPDFLGYEGKKWITNTIDTPADYIGIRPVMKLATELIKDGTVPLWNPYMGAGRVY